MNRRETKKIHHMRCAAKLALYNDIEDNFTSIDKSPKLKRPKLAFKYT
jgi:hypothetical protein